MVHTALWTGFALFLASALASAWGYLVIRVQRQRRQAPTLAPASSAPPQVDVTVLLPVRDEERNIHACLDTLLAQSAHPQVLVIDDGSTDRTAAWVAARAAQTSCLRLIPAGPLPPNWPGKVHALEVGLRASTTHWLLLTDADTRHHPELLARAVATAVAGGFSVVSVAGREVAVGVGENLLTPPVFALLDFLLGDWQAAACGHGPAVANGQFLLIEREMWLAAGGFATVRRAPIDDVAIAAQVRAAGRRTAFFRAPDLLVVRMYCGWRATLRGWRRNLGALLGPRAPGVLWGILTMTAGPPLLIGLALVSGHWVAALVLWAGGGLASTLLRRGSGNAPGYGLLFPCDALALGLLVVVARRDFRRGKLTPWKGREVVLPPF